MPRFWLVVSLVVFALAPLGASARAAGMVAPVGYRAKDFTLVKRDGLYHLFYILHSKTLSFAQNERVLGHAISQDLYTWTQLDPVLPARPLNWDRDHIWAPSIVERDGVYYLFYTGVTGSTYQRLGVATSTDLAQWNRMDTPIFTCASVPWCFCDTTSWDLAFRDPFVMPDPGTPGRWLMYYSTSPAGDSANMIVGVAASSGDFTRWSDLEPLWITHRSYSWNPVVESSHLFRHGSLWYLFFTTSSGQPLSFATGPDPLSGPSGWMYRGRLGAMLGLDTSNWYASEYLKDGDLDYFAFVNSERIEIWRIAWGSDDRFTLALPDPFHVVRMTWSTPQVQVGASVTLKIEATAWAGRSIQLDAFVEDPDRGEQQIPSSEMGLPDSIPLTGAVTSYAWTARSGSIGDADGPGSQIVFRLRDRTCETAPLTVLPAGSAGADSRGGGTDLKLRMLRAIAPGASPSLLAELPAASPARLDIFDLQGRRIRTLAERTLPPGASVWTWDCRDANGAQVPCGVYLARLTTPRAALTARVIVLR